MPKVKNRLSGIKRSIYRSIGKTIKQLDGHISNGIFEPNDVEVNHIKLYLPRLDRLFYGYRIVQISDIHIGTWINYKRLTGIIDIVNQHQPDLIVLTGDFVTFEPLRFADELTSCLSKLAPHDAALAVLGNHDHWTDADVVREVLKDSNILDLSNKFFTINRGDEKLHIAGVDVSIEELDRLDLVLDQLPPDGAAILLAHEPDFADQSALTGRFDLQLSGHSHGGQINLPVIGIPILPPKGRKYPSGLYQINGMSLYTNRGVGTAVMQLRWNCPPEITVFTLLV